jgi:hypothetical protein
MHAVEEFARYFHRTNGVRRVVTALELIQHPLAKTGHRETSL